MSSKIVSAENILKQAAKL